MFGSVGTPVIIIAVVVLGILILRRPMKWIFRLLFNTIGGFVSLFMLNLVGSAIGINLGLTLFNAVVVGILGLPGVALLLILPWILR